MLWLSRGQADYYRDPKFPRSFSTCIRAVVYPEERLENQDAGMYRKVREMARDTLREATCIYNCAWDVQHSSKELSARQSEAI